ncbi:MAG: DUF1993 family protein [Paracoccaceae bacterium]
MTPTNRLVPAYLQMLRGLAAWLAKARDQRGAAAADRMMAARLAPDMFPLAAQVRFVCYQAREAMQRLRGEALPPATVAIAEAARSGVGALTVAEAEALIAETVGVLEALPEDALDGHSDRAIALELPNGMIFDMSAEVYVRDWALAQNYFHLVTAYAILRKEGIALGKADYVAHMFAHLRPGTAPGG